MSIYDCSLGRPGCNVQDSIMYYRPSLAANVSFLTLFAISGVAHVVQGFVTKKPYFMWAMILGCVTEVIGYAGRLISWHNPFSLSGFLINICCLTLAPAFFAAALYFTLGDVVRNVSIEASRIKPRTYALIFIPCDCISLTLQGTGGGLASSASQSNQNVDTPTHVMVAGLAFQVATMTAFVLVGIDYFIRVQKLKKRTNNPIQVLCSKKRLVLFTVFFTVAIINIYIRTVYRVIELVGGWSSSLYRNQTKFIVLEGVMVLSAVYFLHIGHPGNLSRGKVVSSTPDAVPTLESGLAKQPMKQKSGMLAKLGMNKQKRSGSDSTLVTSDDERKPEP